MRRRQFLGATAVLGAGAVAQSAHATSTVAWQSTADWDDAASESGVVHGDVGDHDAGRVTQGYPATAEGLRAYWPLHERDGPATDATGEGHDATANGDPTYDAPGILRGSAVSLDGDGDAFVADDPDLGQSFTVSMWVRADSIDSDAMFVSKRGTGQDVTYQVGPDPDNDAWRFFVNDDGNNGVSVHNDTRYTTGEWVLHTVVFDGDLHYYVDGGNRASAGVDVTAATNDEPVYVGARNDGLHLDGDVCEVRLYDRALSESEVAQLYETVEATGELVSDWRDLPGAADGLTTTSTVPADTSAEVVVEQDTTGDGAVDASRAVSLSGGDAETSDLSGFDASTGRYRVRLRLDTADVTSAASVDSVTVQSPAGGSGGGVLNTRQLVVVGSVGALVLVWLRELL